MRARTSGWIGALLVGMLAAACGGGSNSTTPQAPADIPEFEVQIGCQCEVSDPTNGTHFVQGEGAIIWVAFWDDAGNPLTAADLSTANLYMYGPQEQSLTTTAVALLRASTDRNARPHHYIDLLSNPEATWDGNVVSYQLSPVTNELPGTYAITIWSRLAADNLQQWMPVDTVQIGTSVPETQTVERENCGTCHLGSESGKYYLHHIDPGYSPTGNHSLDSWPVRTCKSCHNQDGYAAYSNGGSSGDSNFDRTPDPIVRRVHGVHMGADLKAPFNNDPDTGDFRDYIHVEFPADVRNCTTCHVDDRWKTKPARLACGACHDNVWFGDAAATPIDWKNHPGGPMPNDDVCSICHPPDVGGVMPISVAHRIAPTGFNYEIELTLDPPLAPGDFYDGSNDESVEAVIKIRDIATSQYLDATSDMTSAVLARANFYVSGPRAATHPVLTRAALGRAGARASVTNGTDGPWDLSGDPLFTIGIGSGLPYNISAAASNFLVPSAATQAEVVAWLNQALPFGIDDVATAYASGASKVTIKGDVRGEPITISPSPVATVMGWPIGTFDPAPHYYPNNDLRVPADPLEADPRITRSGNEIRYRLGRFSELAPGTYSAFIEVLRSNYTLGGISLVNFQVGTGDPEDKIAMNCNDCHGETRMHASYFAVPFDPDICKSCHDYGREGEGIGWAGAPPNGTDGTSTSGWAGFGAKPLSARIHGVHRGHYLDYPEDVKPPYRNGSYQPHYDFSEVIFPQDIRNCTKCHSESLTWTQKPSRLACLACHDSDAAATHGALMTMDPTPHDPWSGDEQESCMVCHGAGADFAPSVMHNVWDPYAPPYLREK